MTKKIITFEIGDTVELKSNPNRSLTVLDIEDTDETGADLDYPMIVVGHFTDVGEFEDFALPAAALRKA